MARTRTLKNIAKVSWYSHFRHPIFIRYTALMSLYDQIDSKLIGSNIYWKKTSQTVTIDKDDCAFSVVYSLLKIRVKHIYLKISLEFLGGRINHVGKKVPTWYNDFAFHVSNHVDIRRMLIWVKKTRVEQFRCFILQTTYLQNQLFNFKIAWDSSNFLT